MLMTIEMLNKATILVSLDGEELQMYSLRFDEMTDEVETGLKKLLTDIGGVCGLSIGGKSYLIEALPSKEGCLLIISVRCVKRRKIYRIKRCKTRELCVFFDADAMLDFYQVMKPQGAFYLYEGRYVYLPLHDTVPERLSEYGELYPVSPTVFARVRECGRLLLQKEIQRRHISGGRVAVGDAAFRRA